MPVAAFLLSTGLQTALLSPFIAMMISVGEEYGWRGTLQPELMKLGRIKGVALVGLIWGVWHAPIIAMGHNYPGHPVAGIFLMTLYTLGLGFILGLAFIKSRSVWLVAYLHGVNNQVLAFLMMLVYRPNDPVWSFGVGALRRGPVARRRGVAAAGPELARAVKRRPSPKSTRVATTPQAIHSRHNQGHHQKRA